MGVGVVVGSLHEVLLCLCFLSENRKQVHGGEQAEQGMLEGWGERTWYESLFEE